MLLGLLKLIKNMVLITGIFIVLAYIERGYFAVGIEWFIAPIMYIVKEGFEEE